jgi:hypothetical protein
VSYCKDAEDFRKPKRLAGQSSQRTNFADVATTNKMLYWVY